MNPDTRWLVGLVGPEAWIEWAVHVPKFQRKGFGRAAKANPPDTMAVYWTAGLIKPGTTRANRNVDKVMVFVIDDVGTQPGKSKISEEMLGYLGAPEPTAIIETSPNNHQWQYVMTDGYDEDTHRALHASVPWKSDATAPSNLIKLPMGVNGKKGLETFRTRLVKRGRTWTAAELIAACGGLSTTVAAVRKSARELLAPSPGHVEAAIKALPNDWNAIYCKDRAAWIALGHAWYGATGGEGGDDWRDWNAGHVQEDDVDYVWDSFYATTVGWVKLHWIAREQGSGFSIEHLAEGSFDDGEDVTAATSEEEDDDAVEALQRDVANLIVKQYGDGIRYNVSTSLWHRFDQTWKESPHPLGYRLAKKWADRNAILLGKKARADVSKSAFYSGVEKILQADEHLAVTKADFDVDDWLLGTPGGTVELRTGKLRPPDPRDMISLSTNVVPAETEDCPRWLAFVDWACTDPATGKVDVGMRRMLRQWAGYNLTGDVSKEAVMFHHGGGANGKGTFIETLQAAIGSYFYMADKDLFVENKQHGPHTEEIAALAGKRMVVADEVPTSSRWNESLLKAVSGGGTMSTRHLYGRVFAFAIKFKVTIIGNEKPSFQGAINEALRRRLHLAEFRMTAKPIDDTLKKTLAAEAPGVLRWMLNGLGDMLGSPGGKLFVADSTISATDDYFNENDMFGLWLKECVTYSPGASTTASDAFQSWMTFKGREGGNAVADNPRAFKEEMVRRGYLWKKTKTANVFKDILVVAPVDVF
jgi:putative DNA primase/helicase